MRIADKTNKELIEELETLRLHTAELEKSEAGRKQAEKALREVEEDYRRLFERAPVGITILDMKGVITYCNPAVYKQGSYSEGDYIGKHFSKLTPARSKDIPKFIRIFHSIVRGEIPKPFEVSYKRKDGTTGWSELNVGLLKIGGKRHILVIQHDVTERKRAKAVLQAEKNKLQSVISALEDGLTIQDRDYNIIYQNEPLQKNYGDCVGEKCYRVYEGEEKLCDECPVEMAFKDGKSHTSERRVVLPSGEAAFGETTASPVRDAKGKIVSCLEIVRNITERKQADEALQAEKNKLQSVVDAVEYGLTIQDTDYNIIYQNEPSRISSGGDHVGDKCYRVYAFKDKVCNGCPVAMAFQDGKSHTVERKQVTSSGEVNFWENTASPIRDAKGKIVYCLEVTRNITERRQADEALQAEKNKLQSVVDALEYGLTIQDRDYNILYQNEPLKIIFGDRLGEKCYQAYEGGKKLCDGCPVKKAFKDGKSHTSERRVIMPSGEVNFWENTASPIRDAEGRIVSCLEIARNITERKQAEEALVDEATRRRILVDQSREGIVVLDQDGKVYEVNQRFADMLGYTLEEAAELYVWDWEYLFPPEQVVEMIRTVDEAGDHFETRHRRKDGSVYDVEISTNGAIFAGQKLIFCVCRDITERKEAEEKIQQQNEFLNNILDSLTHPFYVLDANDYTMKMANLAAGLGDLSENQTCYSLTHKKDKPCGSTEHVCPLEEVKKTKKPVVVEHIHYDEDGNARNIEVHGYPIFDTEGNVVQMIEYCLDITERKRTEENLRESEEFRSSMLVNSPTPISVIDPDTSIRYVNPALEKLTGFSAAELIGRKAPYPYWAEEELEKISVGFEKAMREGAEREEELFQKKNGERFWVEITCTPVIGEGGFKYLLANWVDITERKRAEEELRGNQEALQKMFESVTDGISVIDLNGVITEANKEAVRMHGFSSRDEFVGKNALELVAPRDHERVATNMRKALKQGTVKGVEYTLLKADGSEFPGELSTSALKDAAGNWVGHVTISRDITKRKQGEAARREAEEKFKNLVESTSDMVWEADRVGAYTFVNPKIKDLLGYQADEVVGKKRTLDLAPEEEKRKWLNRFKEINARRVPFSGFEIIHLHKDGRSVVFEISGAPFFDSAGNFKGYVGVNKDVTERKRAEGEVERQKAYFQQLFDNSPEGIALLDDVNRFVKVNKGFEMLFGYQTEEIKGLVINEVIVPEDRIEEASALSGAALSSQVRREETVRKRKDGSLVDVDVIGYPIRFDNQTVGVYAIYSDITERKQAEKALKESQQFSSSLLENSPNPAFVVNPDTSVRYVNPAFEKLTGFTLAEITGREAPYPWWPEEQRKEISTSFKNAMVTGGRRSERVFRKKNGERFWVAINSAPVVHEGELIYFLISWLDITERKRMEEERVELEQKAHLASRLASVGEMAAGIAHEINNPMTAVIGFAQLLMDADLPDDVKEDIGVIHKEAQRAAGVAKNLLTFARKHTLAKHPTNINSIIEGVLKLRAYEQSVSNIRVNTRFASDLPQVMIDYSQMQQVFINIILNAENAMLEASNRGTLTVTTQRVNDTVRASFTDSGPGIAKENLNRIFDPFFTTKEVGKGTGLGLSVCHGIVIEHGGRIYARSKLGGGATFVVELPISAHSSGGRS